MDSATKRDLDRSEIQRVINAVLGPTAEIVSLHEFTDGFFNAVGGRAPRPARRSRYARTGEPSPRGRSAGRGLSGE